MLKILGSAVLALGLLAPAAAMADINAPSVAEILARTPEANGLFAADDKGAARHLASGLVCPLVFPNVNLWHLEVFAPDGSDVGCDYGRNGATGRATTKVTIFVTKAQPGATVDRVFTDYQTGIKMKYPDAQATGPAIRFQGDPPDGMKDIRSEEYSLVFDGHKAVSDLVVTIQAGWVIEIRSTTMTEVTDANAAGMAAGDMALPFLTLTQAVATVGKAPAAATP